MGWVILDGANNDKVLAHGRSAIKAWWNVPVKMLS